MPEVKSAGDCPIHAGQGNSENRLPLDPAMRALKENQSGSGRHKCPYCAYEHGYEQAKSDMAERLSGLQVNHRLL